MKRLIDMTAVLLACVSGEALALCSSTQVIGMALETLIVGKTVCATRSAERWQEQHQGGPTSGQLWDYKRGPGHATDPMKHVGAWRIVGNNVNYAYLGGAGIFTYTVHDNGDTTYDFCTGGAPIVTGATFTSVFGSCFP